MGADGERAKTDLISQELIGILRRLDSHREPLSPTSLDPCLHPPTCNLRLPPTHSSLFWTVRNIFTHAQATK